MVLCNGKDKKVLIGFMVGVLFLLSGSWIYNAISDRNADFSVRISLNEQCEEGNPVTCEAFLTYTGKKAITCDAKHGIKLVFEHESGMRLYADYCRITSDPVLLEEGSTIVFDCSDYGAYSYQLVSDGNTIERVDYNLLLSHTPLFLVAGDYEVYLSVNGHETLNPDKMLSYVSKKQTIHVTQNDERNNIDVYEMDDMRGKSFLNLVKFKKADTLYCFSYYQIQKQKETTLFFPQLRIEEEESVKASTVAAEDVGSKWNVNKDAIFIITPRLESFANHHVLAYNKADEKRSFDQIDLNTGDYEFVTSFIQENGMSRIVIPFEVE